MLRGLSDGEDRGDHLVMADDGARVAQVVLAVAAVWGGDVGASARAPHAPGANAGEWDGVGSAGSQRLGGSVCDL